MYVIVVPKGTVRVSVDAPEHTFREPPQAEATFGPAQYPVAAPLMLKHAPQYVDTEEGFSTIDTV